jgi:phage terminase large subunit
MIYTSTYGKTLQAYLAKKRYIINEGGTRSGKTYGILQLLYQIAKWSKKPLIIHIVSHSTPHLKDGAIADFEKQLHELHESLSAIRTQNPHTYKIGVSTIKFIGFDKLGKALGAARNILFINEANKMAFEVCHQLIQRTEDTIFIDFNPSHEFWVDTEGYREMPDSTIVHSTFKDNYQNLTEGILRDLLNAKRKHDEAESKGEKGYWWNYWRVYGLGLKGQLEGAIFNYWRVGEFDHSLPYIWGMDWGQSDPHTLIKVAIDNKKMKIYIDEYHYAPLRSSGDVLQLLAKHCKKNELIIADINKGNADIILQGYNLVPAHKPPGSVQKGIQDMQDYELIITERSKNVKKELENYIWLDKKGDVPIDAWNHTIDPTRYVLKYFRRMF